MFGYVGGDPTVEATTTEPSVSKQLRNLTQRELNLLGLIEELEGEVDALQLQAERAESVPRPPARGVM